MKRYCLDCKKLLTSHSNPTRCASCANAGKNNPMFGKSNKWGKHTEESKEKMSLKHKGAIVSSETREKISKNSPKIWKGKKLSKEHIDRMVTTRKLKGSYRPHTEEHKRKVSLKMSGDKTHLWKGGVTPINHMIRWGTEMKIWKQKVLERDKFICQIKNCPYCNNQRKAKLNIHHIKQFALFPELRFNIDNGITYCEEYHLKEVPHLRNELI